MLVYSSFQQYMFWFLLSALAAIGGSMFVDRNFYRKRLILPWFAPPPFIFSVWSVLYVLLSIGAYRVQVALDSFGYQLWIYVAFLIVSTSWTPVFFRCKNLLLSLMVIVASWALIVTVNLIIFLDVPGHSAEGWWFFPTTVWVTFATILNASIYHLNPFD